MKQLTALATAAALGLAGFGSIAAPVTYTFDAVHSRVTFYVNHFGFSNSVGEFKVGAGTFTFDNDDWSNSRVEVKLPVQSLELGDAKWNSDILNAGFLEAAKYPEIGFVSSKVDKLASGKARLYGDLTIKGVTKPVVLELRVNKLGDHPTRKTPAAGFTATTTIKRSEFGVTKLLPMVSDDVEVRIEVEAFVAPPG